MPKQTKTKSRSRNILLKRIHSNRWLIWAISIAVIVAGSLVAYISISNINDSAQQAFLNLQPRPNYSNQQLGFVVDYPKGWLIDSSSDQSVTFDNPKNDGESISITEAPIASVAKVEKTANAKIQTQYVLRGNQMVIMTVPDPEGGTPNQIGIVQTPSKAYFVTGNSSQLATFLNDIRPF